MNTSFISPVGLRFARNFRLQSSSSNLSISNRTTPVYHLVRTMATLISPSAASEQLKSDSPPLYLDVRTPTEFANGHAPSAVNIPVMLNGASNPEFLDSVRVTIQPDTSLIVGCKSGKRSTMAINILKENGFSNLQEVDGGFDAWLSDSSLPIEN